MGVIARGLTFLLVLASLQSATDARAQAADGFPGMQLRERVATHVQMEKYTLKEEGLGHYGLIFPIQPRELQSFMRLIELQGSGEEIVPGSAQGPELHGGAVLAFLLDHWRPGGRPARLDDEFEFVSPSKKVALRDIYRAHQSQIFLPVDGQERPGELPRMKYELASANHETKTAEVDSYKFLGVLVAQETDYTRTWTDRAGQTLSTDLLLRRAWEHYLTQWSPEAEVADHANLHLVELLLAFNRGRMAMPIPTSPSLDSNQIKERFLATELKREDFQGEEGHISLVHYVESLGRLLQDPHVRWTRAERKQVREWLADLERRWLQPIEALSPYQLAHLLRGLQWVDEFRGKLD
jgi:hypothetical protein